MREILFRGKEIESGEWIFGSLLSGYLENGRTQILNHDNGDMEDIIPETVGQFTGEMEFISDEDGNVTRGNKIFDGDVIRIESAEDGDGEFLVVWDYEKGGWQFQHLRGTRGTDCPDALKVIGNIYDNPELLGESHEHH